MRENKLKSLTRIRLLDEIRKSNPELLDLKHTIIRPAEASRQEFF